ncbi:MAG: L-seryl-tRNA(Sec) selenium transferase [Bacillota bacterium]|nr:L-seryl-tRNA(Sec) selenium transferase [Bacillota bacterium]
MDKAKLYREIPKVDQILFDKKIIDHLKNIPLNILKFSIDKILNNIRNEIKNLNDNEVINYKLKFDTIIDKIISDSTNFYSMNLKKVINGTGIVIHTNLGRSCINEEIAKEIYKIASNYSNLEFDLETGKRGHRYTHVEDIICLLTGAESALVVNNNAAAVMLVLDTLAKGKEAIVSRGELVEIGGSFRIPDVMERSGTILKEVGTTNKTHLRDYEHAISSETGMLLKVHTSNYRILGFTESVNREDLVTLGKDNNIPVYEDLGSGLLFDFSNYFSMTEPTIKDVVSSGVDIVSFSGDKMLGGPQTGIIIGKKEYIEKMKYNQLTRALRVDKMTLAALEITLRQYFDKNFTIENIPTIKNIIIDSNQIKKKADILFSLLAEIDKLNLEIIKDTSQVGGGSMPLTEFETYALSISIDKISPNNLAKSLRICNFPIVGRIKNESFLLDLRTIDELDFNSIKSAFLEILSGGENV